MKWVWISLVGFFGLLLVVRGCYGLYRGEMLAIPGGTKSGPMSPSAVLLVGLLLLFAGAYALLTTQKTRRSKHRDGENPNA